MAAMTSFRADNCCNKWGLHIMASNTNDHYYKVIDDR